MIDNMFNGVQPNQNVIGWTRTGIGYVLNWVRLVGTGLAMIMLVWIGLRYITSEPGKKAELKKSTQNYLIGLVFFIGATNIVYFVMEFVSGLF